MYTFDSRVRYSEIGENGKIRLDALIDYMQDCTNFQSEDLGVGLEFYRQKARMWVLSSWQILIRRYPVMGEKITVGTQSYGWEKIFGYRNFLIVDDRKEWIVKANSLWVLIDTNTGRPAMVTPELGDVYGKAEKLDMEYAPRKIKLPEDGRTEHEILVQKYHLDTNHHVNNRQYVQMAMQFLPQGAVVSELRAEYKMEAKFGDSIVPVVYDKDRNEVVVALNQSGGKAFSVVQFILA